MESAGLCRAILLGNPAEPVESDRPVRVTVADRDRAPGGSFLIVSSVVGISICIGAVEEISGSRMS